MKVEGKQNSMFPEGPVIMCFVIPPNSKKEKNAKKDSLDTCGGCACSTSGSETELSYPNDKITVFFLIAVITVEPAVKYSFVSKGM